jgi:hypothetical protein
VYISPELVVEQWRAWGEPRLEWIPGGHMTFPLFVRRIVGHTADFYAALAPALRAEAAERR